MVEAMVETIRSLGLPETGQEDNTMKHPTFTIQSIGPAWGSSILNRALMDSHNAHHQGQSTGPAGRSHLAWENLNAHGAPALDLLDLFPGPWPNRAGLESSGLGDPECHAGICPPWPQG